MIKQDNKNNPASKICDGFTTYAPGGHLGHDPLVPDPLIDAPQYWVLIGQAIFGDGLE